MKKSMSGPVEVNSRQLLNYKPEQKGVVEWLKAAQVYEWFEKPKVEAVAEQLGDIR